jgi:hypothetical protein
MSKHRQASYQEVSSKHQQRYRQILQRTNMKNSLIMIELRKGELKNKLVGITEQGQTRLAKKIIFFILLSFGNKLRSFFVLQLVRQRLKFFLQRINILAGLSSYFNCAFKL